MMFKVTFIVTPHSFFTLFFPPHLTNWLLKDKEWVDIGSTMSGKKKMW
jgi:hypothetical protein